MSRFSRRSLMKSYDQRTGRRVPGATLVEDGEKPGLLVRRGEDDAPHPLSQPFAPAPDRIMLLGAQPKLEPAIPTNLITQQSNFATSPWSLTAMTQTQNALEAPDGTDTAARLLKTAAVTSHYVSTSAITIAASTTYALSAHVKMIGGLRRLYLMLADSGATNYAYVTFDSATGTVDSGSNDGTTATVIKTGVWRLDWGWYRIWISARLASTSGRFWVETGDTTADASQGFGLWGTRFELGDWPSAYSS